jgi:hypothetical protein
MRIKMKKLLMSVSFLVLLSSASMAKTETITEEVCNAPNGCRIEMTTGKCIGCVMITRTIVTKDPIVVVKEKTKTIASPSIEQPKRITKSDYKIDPVTGMAIARCLYGCNSSSSAFHKKMFEGMYWTIRTGEGRGGFAVTDMSEEQKEWVRARKL